LLLCCNTCNKSSPKLLRRRGRGGYPSAARRAIVYCVATRLQQKQPQATSKIEATGLEIFLASKIWSIIYLKWTETFLCMLMKIFF
jgi:hypothetical protein